MNYCFDIDGTICTENIAHDYKKAKPDLRVIKQINKLYDQGHKIIIMTARGMSSGLEWRDFTEIQLKKWGLKYHELITGKKPDADIFIDDKAQHISDFKRQIGDVGIIAGSFDVIHAGYIKLFEDGKKQCSKLIIALQTDPNIERPEKCKIVQSLDDRELILSSIKYVDEIHTYTTEKDLEELFLKLKPDIRILGSDYIRKKITGHDLIPKIYYHNRNHTMSTTKLKSLIKQT